MPTHAPNEPIHFGSATLRALCYILLIVALTQGVYYEALYLEQVRFTELGFTELAQTALLASASALLLYVRQALRQLPHVTLLMFAFVFSSLIREQDSLLDHYIADGTWQVLVSLVIVPILGWVILRRQAFADEFSRYANSASFGMFAAGILTTYVFSRLYGRSEMWMAILGDSYQRTFKDAAEEAVELLGYTLILIAMIELLLLARRWARRRT